MYRNILKHLISFIVAPIEVLFIPSPLAFDGLHDDKYFCCMKLVSEVIIKKLQLQSEHKHTIIT